MVFAVAALLLASGHVWWLAVLLGLVAALPASELAVNLTNFAVAQLFSPQRLPKLEFREGVPASATTLVVVPAMLTGPREIQQLVERLELHFLANPEPNVWFALVTDHVDAQAQVLPDDQALVQEAIERIRAVNERNGSDGRGALPAAPSRSPMERQRRSLDGLGAKTWQAHAAQSLAANRIDRGILHYRGTDRRLDW